MTKTSARTKLLFIHWNQRTPTFSLFINYIIISLMYLYVKFNILVDALFIDRDTCIDKWGNKKNYKKSGIFA